MFGDVMLLQTRPKRCKDLTHPRLGDHSQGKNAPVAVSWMCVCPDWDLGTWIPRRLQSSVVLVSFHN